MDKPSPQRQHEDGFHALSCCPELEKCDTCDVLDFRYRLPFRPVIGAADKRQPIPVEVTLWFRLVRCPGPLALGDLVYSTTLLPGEKVRLFTSDRHTRFSFDTESKLAYRQHQSSEESYFAAGMAEAMSNLSIVENSNRTNAYHESSVSGGGGAGLDLGFVSFGGSVSASSYDALSTNTFARALAQHAESSSRHIEVATRAASSTSIGEVQSRTHTQSESEDHYESGSRQFSNPNRCHAVTYFFYRINKCQTLRFELIAIERRVEDPAAPTGVNLNPAPPSGGVSAIPSGILATSRERLEAERRARTSVLESHPQAAGFVARVLISPVQPIDEKTKRDALEAVDTELVKGGLLDKVGGEVDPAAQKRYGWERQISLPTPGVVVKGCLDECEVCEPTLEKEIELEIERKKLENERLKRAIELMDQDQEHRCCPEPVEDSED